MRAFSRIIARRSSFFSFVDALFTNDLKLLVLTATSYYYIMTHSH